MKKLISILSILFFISCKDAYPKEEKAIVLEYKGAFNYCDNLFKESMSKGYSKVGTDSALYFLGKAQAYHDACHYIRLQVDSILK